MDVKKFIECVGNAVNACTRLCVFDAITRYVLVMSISMCLYVTFFVLFHSPTGIVLPLLELVQKCRAKGVPVLIDGAHGPGQVTYKHTHTHMYIYIYIYIYIPLHDVYVLLV